MMHIGAILQQAKTLCAKPYDKYIVETFFFGSIWIEQRA